MNVIIFGATGGLGQWTWKAALEAGHQVTAFVRSPHKLADHPERDRLRVVVGDVMDGVAVGEAAAGCTVAINCTSPAGGNSALEMAASIVRHASEAGVSAFYMVGGIGALWAPGTDQTILVQDWDPAEATAFGFPSNVPAHVIRRMTQGHLASMAHLEQSGVAHTYVCPGAMLDEPASASRVVTLDELGGAAAMRVRMGDVAQVIVDDVGKGALLGHRVSVVSGG